MPERAAPHLPWCFVRLLGLSAVAIVQPVFDVLGRSAEFFAAHAATPTDVIGFTLALYLAPPLLATACIAGAAAFAPRIAHLLEASIVGLLFGLVCGLVGLRFFDAQAALWLVLAIAGGLAAAGSHARFENARTLASAIGLMSPVVPLLFLFSSPVASLLRPVPDALPEHAVRAPSVPMVVLLFDELPLLSLLNGERRIDAIRFPHFAALAETSDWFRNATTVSDGTSLAVPSILTGRRATGRQLSNFASHPENLFTWLTPTHTIRARESSTSLCPASLCRGLRGAPTIRLSDIASDAGIVALRTLLPDSLLDGVPPIDDRWAGFAIEESFDEQFRDFTAGFRPGRGATLDYLHVNLPHAPWEYLPSGQTHVAADAGRNPRGLEGNAWSEHGEHALRGHQLHLLQVGYADRLLGEWMAAMRDLGVFDDTLIVVVSDHGVSFEPGQPWRSVTAENHVELMAIPLFIKAPAQREGRIFDHNVETIDLLPTLADLLDVELPWAVDGASALDPNVEPRAEKAIAKFGYSRTLRFPAELEDWPRALSARIARTGTGDDWDRFYSVGPKAGWIGRRVGAEIPLGEPDASTLVLLDDPEAFRDVDLAGPSLPVHVVGTVRTEGGWPEALAFGLDGVIVATATPFVDARRKPKTTRRFETLLSADRLRDGENDFAAYAVEGDRLVSIELGSRPVYHIEERDGREVIVRRRDGHILTAPEDGARGRIESIRETADGVEITGFAYLASEERERVPDRFVVFHDGVSVYQGSTNRVRGEVAREHRSNDLAYCGFSFRLRSLRHDDANSLTVVAIYDEDTSPSATRLER